ncbi:MAG: hypothetical protein U7M05_12315, partial [Candidatus Igneacidithiobacillus chanchocoensis]
MILPSVDRFLQRTGALVSQSLVALVDLSVRRAAWMLAAIVLATLLALVYSVSHFSVDTDTSHALSRDLPFQQREVAYQKAFPQDKNTIVVVLQGDNQNLTDTAVDRLSAWLRARPQSFHDVYVPGGGAFFQRNGLLYLSPKEVQAFANRIT